MSSAGTGPAGKVEQERVCLCVCVSVCLCVCVSVCVCACVYLICHLAVLSVPGLSLVEEQLTLHQPAQSSHSKVSFKLFREQSCAGGAKGRRGEACNWGGGGRGEVTGP